MCFSQYGSHINYSVFLWQAARPVVVTCQDCEDPVDCIFDEWTDWDASTCEGHGGHGGHGV